MKLLFVAPWIPSPLRPRSLSLLSLLCANHEVHFLAPARTKADRSLAEHLPGCASVTLVRDPRWRSLVRTAIALLRGQSLQTGYANSPAFRRALQAMLVELDPAAVHLNVFRTAHLAPLVHGRALVMDLDEYRSDYYRQLATQHPRRLWRALGRYESAKMAEGERRLESLGCTLLLSTPRVASMPSNVFEVPSVSLLPSIARGNATTEKSIVFVGRFTYEANRDAIRWFVDECWDAILSQAPDARLVLVGDGPPRDIRRRVRPSIAVTGRVTSTAPYYERAAAVIAPIRLATGVQMKLIEGLSYGKPVVCSPLVARLAGVRHGEEVLVASTPQDWVMAIVATLRDPVEAAAVGARGRRWVATNHSTNVQRVRLAEAYTASMHRYRGQSCLTEPG